MAAKQQLTPVEDVIGPFDAFRAQAWPYHFEGTLFLPVVAGGTPSDPKVARAWLMTKLADRDDLIREKVATIMEERKVTAEEATKIVDDLQHLNGFLRDKHAEDTLCLEGRHLKACLKEAASVAMAAEKIEAKGWGKTKKGLLGFIAEHVVVVNDRLDLYREDGWVGEPTGIMQRFVHTWRGDAIQYEEFVQNCYTDFTVMSDYEFDVETWAMIWLTAEQQGLGASRSQGFGRFQLKRWEQVAAA